MIDIEASVHPITQDCCSNKTEKKPNTLRSEEALTWRKQRPVLPPPLTNGAPPQILRILCQLRRILLHHHHLLCIYIITSHHLRIYYNNSKKADVQMSFVTKRMHWEANVFCCTIF
ncbi:hypothetical protein ACJW30_02G006200 [Castanea mollissima]